MDTIARIRFIVLVSLLLMGCQSFVKKADLEFINDYYDSRAFFVKQNIPIGNKEILEEGTSVKILIEASSSIIKVKCFPSNQDRETSLGKMVAYVVTEDIKNKNFTVEDLEELIAQKLSNYNIPRKNLKTKKNDKF